MFSQGSVLGTGNGMAAAESWGLLLPLVRLLRLRTMAIHVFGHIKNATSELAITHTHRHTSTNTKLNAKLSFCRLSMFLIKSLWFVFWMEIEGVWWVRMILVNDKRNRLNSRASSYPSTFTPFPGYIKTDLRTDQNPKLVKMISA